MKNLKTTMEINGRTFEVFEHFYTNDELSEIAYSTHNLFYYYKNPSRIKEDIYRDWGTWSWGVDNLYYFGVSGANSMQFTIMAIMEDVGNPLTGEIVDIVLKITKDHNKAIIVK